ncbi:hypothetical protein H8E88_07095 [candidate division KSB1 bacterium]|nr:hypothetical protein [candidate division KSB1 bacterium]MBL7092637.1 hypothetical protein [candidate division KSB1 bacterium]
MLNSTQTVWDLYHNETDYVKFTNDFYDNLDDNFRDKNIERIKRVCKFDKLTKSLLIRILKKILKEIFAEHETLILKNIQTVEIKANGVKLPNKRARQFVLHQDEKSEEWKALHNLMSFWRYINLLERDGYIEDIFAFEAFMSPRLLGFLYPVEEAYFENNGISISYEKSLKRLYDRWSSSIDVRI